MHIPTLNIVQFWNVGSTKFDIHFKGEGESSTFSTCWSYFVENFSLNLLVFTSCQNSKQFSRYRDKRVRKNAIFGPQNWLNGGLKTQNLSTQTSKYLQIWYTYSYRDYVLENKPIGHILVEKWEKFKIFHFFGHFSLKRRKLLLHAQILHLKTTTARGLKFGMEALQYVI